jgi:hypothetical protein
MGDRCVSTYLFMGDFGHGRMMWRDSRTVSTIWMHLARAGPLGRPASSRHYVLPQHQWSALFLLCRLASSAVASGKRRRSNLMRKRLVPTGAMSGRCVFDVLTTGDLKPSWSVLLTERRVASAHKVDHPLPFFSKLISSWGWCWLEGLILKAETLPRDSPDPDLQNKVDVMLLFKFTWWLEGWN